MCPITAAQGRRGAQNAEPVRFMPRQERLDDAGAAVQFTLIRRGFNRGFNGIPTSFGPSARQTSIRAHVSECPTMSRLLRDIYHDLA